MKNLIVMLWLLALPLAGAAFGADQVGSVEEREGQVTARDADGFTRHLDTGSPIFIHDRITTGPASKVQIRFLDNSLLGQGEQSDMVINDYLYNPAERDQNRSFLQLFSGVFRVVTDQITRLNPDRFAVKTNYGTIGIRGCELGFQLGEEIEQVSIISLHGVEAVLVQMDEYRDRTGQVRRGDALTVTDDGILVSLSRLDGLRQQPLEERAIIDLYMRTLPLPSPATHTAVQMPAAETAALSMDAQPVGEEAAAQARVDRVSKEVSLLGNTVAEGAAVPAVPAQAETLRETAPSRGGGDGGGPTEPTYPIVGPRTTLASGSGAEWSWDVWEQSVTDLVDGTPVTTLTTGDSIRGTRLGAAEFDAIAAGGTLYNLNGSGAAGAVVSQNNVAHVLTGTADLNVRLGLGILPQWSGAFDVSGDGDSLQFQADGGISGGDLSASSVSGYSLNAFGASYGAPGSSSVGGFLVGPGTPPAPVSGAVVEFEFDHGPDAPHVVGAGGADLQ